MFLKKLNSIAAEVISASIPIPEFFSVVGSYFPTEIIRDALGCSGGQLFDHLLVMFIKCVIWLVRFFLTA